jgi:nicotinic acid mononucleotide adenylyltransferase
MRKFLTLGAIFISVSWLSANESNMVGVYTGSFDPPTIAHRKIILKAINENHCDRVIVYVNQFGKKNYHASPANRKKMIELMMKDHSDLVSVMIQGCPDKRVDFQNLRNKNKNLALIVGEDSYYKRLALPEIQHVSVDKIIVIPRSSEYKDLISKLGPKDRVIFIPEITDISSSKIRDQLEKGDLNNIQLDKNVLNYVLEKKLYSLSLNH